MATQAQKLKALGDEYVNKKKEIERTVYYDDFVQSFKALMEFVEKARLSLVEEAGKQGGELDKKLDKAVSTIDSLTKEMNTKHQSLMSEISSDQRTFQRLVNEKLAEMNDSIPDDYNDGELRELIKQVAESIPNMPDEFDASEIESTLEEHEREIEELKKRPTGTGGGVTNMRIAQAFKHILKTEAVSGTIDGANTTFTVTQPIFAILSLSINGEIIAELPNYTISNKTIEFTSPIPASFSGSDFEVKYV